MHIRFLRPELEKLHAKFRAISAMNGTQVSVDAFAWEVTLAQYRDVGAGREVYPGVLLPYLEQHAPPPVSVLCIGGGSAGCVLPLATAGYDVTVLMPAATGLELVHGEAEAAGVGERLSCVCGYASDAGELGEAAFDVVLGLHSIQVERDLRPVLEVLRRVTRKLLCFDVMSRYGFLVGRMPGIYAHVPGFTPESMLHVLTEHETPGGRPVLHERLPLYTAEEIGAIAREAGLLVEELWPMGYRDVLGWQDDTEAAEAELVRRMEEDEVLKDLAASYLIVARKPA